MTITSQNILKASNLYSKSWTLFRDWLKDNMTDPVNNTTGSSRKWVYNIFPEIKDRNFAGYPFIVAEDTGISDEEMTFGIGKSVVNFNFPLTIYVRKQENKYDATQMDALSDELRYKLTKDTTLPSDGLKSVNIEDSPKTPEIIGSEKVISRTFGITFTNAIDRT